MNNRRYTHLFFDLDRTLWDFEANSREVLYDLFHTHELDKLGIAGAGKWVREYETINAGYWEAHRSGKVGKDELRYNRFRDTFRVFGVRSEDLAEKIGDDYIRRTPQKTNLIPGAFEMLEELSEKYAVHLITNGFEDTQYIKLKGSGIDRFFGEVVTSDRAGQRKPHPGIFQFSLEVAKAEPEDSLMIGDDLEADIIGARKFGMDQVYFNPFGRRHREKVTYEVALLKEMQAFL